MADRKPEDDIYDLVVTNSRLGERASACSKVISAGMSSLVRK
jgi:hypothetical protein